MKLATTTGDFNNYADTYEEKITLLSEAGFRYIDIDFCDMDVFMSPKWEDNTKKLLDHAEKLGVKFVQAHSPCCGNPVIYNPARETLMETTLRAFEVCRILGIKNMVVHNGTTEGMDKKSYFEENTRFNRELFPIMEKTGVNLCVENSTVANMPGGRYFFFDGKDMREYIEMLDHPLLKACWDTGHANIEGHHYEDICVLGDLLTTVHVHDNNGRSDEHMMPFSGTMNFDELMCGLIDSGYKGFFTLESILTIMDTRSHLYCRHTFEKDTRLFKTPTSLKLEAEKLLYKTGKYILDAYGVYED